jgi:hypothetical protein
MASRSLKTVILVQPFSRIRSIPRRFRLKPTHSVRNQYIQPAELFHRRPNHALAIAFYTRILHRTNIVSALPQPVHIKDNTYTLDRDRLDVVLSLDIGGYLLRSFFAGEVIDRNIAALRCELLGDESA